MRDVFETLTQSGGTPAEVDRTLARFWPAGTLSCVECGGDLSPEAHNYGTPELPACLVCSEMEALAESNAVYPWVPERGNGM